MLQQFSFPKKPSFYTNHILPRFPRYCSCLYTCLKWLLNLVFTFLNYAKVSQAILVEQLALPTMLLVGLAEKNFL